MPVPDADDAMLRALVQLVESQNERLEAMRQTVVELQRRLQVRSDSDVLLGHELRTPIEIVRAVLSALRDDVPADARDELVARALVQAGYLADLVEDLLGPETEDGVRVPRARLRTTPVRDLVHQAIGAAGLEGAVVADLDPRLTIATAPARVVAVLVDMLEAGGQIDARAGSDGGVVIEVTRPGAAPRPSSLYLSRMLARCLGGDAALTGQLGGATRISVHLPQRRSNDPTPARVTAGDEPR